MVKRLATSDAFIISQTRAADFFVSIEVARATISATIGRMTAMDFAHTVKTQMDEADVYGPLLDGRQWYLKLTVQPVTRLIVISMHPAEKPLETNRERQAKKAKVRK